VSSSASSSASGGGRASAAVAQGEKKEKGGGGGKQEKLDLNPPRGTRDFYPEDMRLQQWLFGEWRAVAALHGFSE
jgi:histidyl-tRNA synthetase